MISRARFTAAIVLIGLTGSCASTFDASRATRAYPSERHRPVAADIQCFRDETRLTIVNATTTSYRAFDLWLNQRFAQRVESLPAGGTIEISLEGFYDDRGLPFGAGGFFRTEAPTRLVLAEIDHSPDLPLVGLIVIEAADRPQEE